MFCLVCFVYSGKVDGLFWKSFCLWGLLKIFILLMVSFLEEFNFFEWEIVLIEIWFFFFKGIIVLIVNYGLFYMWSNIVCDIGEIFLFS